MTDSKTDPKEGNSFFRKVVKFVANPATDWAQLGMPVPDSQESEYAKSELKAMIERKRRNDFVRKREFDMLRKVRREGLSSEQLANLGSSSRLDDSDVRLPETNARPYGGVKAKIDAIEQQMVGDGLASPSRRAPGFYDAPTQPANIEPPSTVAGARHHSGPGLFTGTDSRTGAPITPPRLEQVVSSSQSGQLPHSAMAVTGNAPPHQRSHDLPAATPLAAPSADASEMPHDPELDEAVIAFANADFELCEQALLNLTLPNGMRAQHADTWLALFDLYRATGQHEKFENQVHGYAHAFGLSAPQWFSLPKLVAQNGTAERRPRSSNIDSKVGWSCPSLVDPDVVSQLRSQTLQMPMPWVFDWSSLQTIDTEACARLSELCRSWMSQAIDMHWVGGQHLLDVLQEAAPTGMRDADPVFWQLHLDVLRLVNRPVQFDETAIDYCVTYEVSPPSWEPVVCKVQFDSNAQSTQSPPLSLVSDVSTTFQESQILEEPGMVQVAGVELYGQLVGDISKTLDVMKDNLGAATVVNVSCARLIRVDFIAAGDLLNWVLARRSEQRSVSFSDAHRLVALFFGAMGINEHAKVKIRSV
jgi:hypothetical protein